MARRDRASAPARGAPHRARRAGDVGDPVGRGDRRPDRRVRRRAAREGRDGRRAGRPSSARCCASPSASTSPTSTVPSSTRAAPVATAPAPSTSPRWPRSSRRPPVPASRSTAGRAASSQCGSADVLEALGVVIDLGPSGVARSIREVGHRLLLRAALPRRLALRGAGPPRARHADHVQLRRAARQPGRGEAPDRRRLRPGDGGAARGDARGARAPSGRSCSTATTGSTSSPSPTSSTVHELRDGVITRLRRRPHRLRHPARRAQRARRG